MLCPWTLVVRHLVGTSVSPSPSPAWHPPEVAAAPELGPETGMGVMSAQGMFGKDGQVQWHGVIATTSMSRESRAPDWMGRC